VSLAGALLGLGVDAQVPHPVEAQLPQAPPDFSMTFKFSMAMTPSSDIPANCIRVPRRKPPNRHKAHEEEREITHFRRRSRCDSREARRREGKGGRTP
jgi:hypothetical protein